MHPSWVAPLSQPFVTTISRAAWHRSLALKYEAAWHYSLALKGTPGLLYHYSYGTRNARESLAWFERNILTTQISTQLLSALYYETTCICHKANCIDTYTIGDVLSAAARIIPYLAPLYIGPTSRKPNP